jgi:hypothetical protein
MACQPTQHQSQAMPKERAKNAQEQLSPTPWAMRSPAQKEYTAVPMPERLPPNNPRPPAFRRTVTGSMRDTIRASRPRGKGRPGRAAKPSGLATGAPPTTFATRQQGAGQGRADQGPLSAEPADRAPLAWASPAPAAIGAMNRVIPPRTPAEQARAARPVGCGGYPRGARGKSRVIVVRSRSVWVVTTSASCRATQSP